MPTAARKSPTTRGYMKSTEPDLFKQTRSCGGRMTPRRAFSVGVFARQGSDILLIFHNRLRLWLPVGGEIEANETPLEAALRELKEETGLVGRPVEGNPLSIPGSPPGLLGYEEHDAGPKGLHMNFDFLVDVDSREIEGDGSFARHGWYSTPPPEAPPNVHRFFEIVRAWKR